MTQTALKLDVVKESDFLIEETDTDVIITGTSFTMPPFDPATWSSKNLTVRAYDLILSEDIMVPGKKVSIVTHSLTQFKDITISVSGEAGKPHPISANDGRTHGQGGSNGAEGHGGSHGGEIQLIIQKLEGQKLTLEANGGVGGPGQNGGSGVKGRRGRNGDDRDLWHSDEGGGHRGGAGARGGNAGRGGNGGTGGNAGKIIISSTNPDIDQHIQLSAVPGEGGNPGNNGNPGSGGDGGVGGRGVKCEFEHIGRADRY